MTAPPWYYQDDFGDFDDAYFYEGRAYGYGRRRPAIDVSQALEPLLAHLRRYDAHRVDLEQNGGHIRDLRALTAILRLEIVIPGRYKDYPFSLVNQAGLREMLRDVGDYELFLGVRQLETRLPVYYLCRVAHQYGALYDLILDDLYMSPGYPLPDERFVKLMRRGHELYHVRLSPFRRAAEKIQGKKPQAVDDLLSEVGRHIFQAAWHEDQRLGVMVAQHFGLPFFLRAIEVLYLCLSGELCELRSAATDGMFRFFETVYPQPAIHVFLTRLLRLDGDALTRLTQAALSLYIRLSQAFNQFLGLQVAWGARQDKVQLTKLVFGNFSRLSRVGALLAGNQEVSQARERLEQEARAVLTAILESS